jgi:hypothetical protein
MNGHQLSYGLGDLRSHQLAPGGVVTATMGVAAAIQFVGPDGLRASGLSYRALIWG